MMKSRTRLAVRAAVGMVLLVGTRAAAGPIQPPSVVLVAPQNHVSVARIETGIEDAATGGRIHVTLLDHLSGDGDGDGGSADEDPSSTLASSSTLALRLDTGGLGDRDLTPGRTVVVGWTESLPDRFARGVYKRDPDGARVVALPALGSALWPDSPAIRGFVAAARSTDAESVLDSVLDLLETDSVRLRWLGAVELAIDPALLHQASDESRSRFADTLDSFDPANEVAATRFLLDAVALARRPPSAQAFALARRALDALGPEVDPASNAPGLLIRAAELVTRDPARRDADRLKRHLADDHPGIASAAWDALFKIEPRRARRHARKALDRGDLTADLSAQLDRLLDEDSVP